MRGWLAGSAAVLLSFSAAGCGGIIPDVNAQQGVANPARPARPPAANPAATTQPVSTQPRPATSQQINPPASAPVASTTAIPRPAGGSAILSGTDSARAIGRPLRAGPSIASLGITQPDAAGALAAFRLSCPVVTRREDTAGLTRPADWQAACNAAASWPADNAAGFFERHFETLEIDGGGAFVTGYFEPEIAGSRQRTGQYQTPVYRRPADLIEADLSLFSEELRGKRIRGRVENGRLVPHADRAQIDGGALAGKGLEIAWVADPVEFFFLQVQGSGRLLLPGGDVMRIGYDGQNGHPYVGIGARLRERGVLAPGQASMQGIIDWIRANPAEGRALMNENKSYIFFREITGAGPIGSLGVPVAGESSVAADPLFVTPGAPVWLGLDRAEPNGLWISQDTGGAIKGPNRFDSFWGAGDRARAIAGGMSARGQALLFVPRGSFARLSQNARAAP